MQVRLSACLCVIALCFASCSDESSGQNGSLEFVLEAESTVREGIAAGDAPDELQDGWNVSWQNYVLTVGHVEIVSATEPSLSFAAEDRFVVDLTKVPAAGKSLWRFDDVRAGRWNVFYEVGEPEDAALRDTSVNEVDFDRIVAEDLTYLIRGTLSSSEGQSCPPTSKAEPGDKVANGNVNARGDACYDRSALTIEVAVDAGALYGPCEVDEIAGAVVPSGGLQSASLTIHGDHMFFNGFPEGQEGGTTRRAQWFADADLNLDGTVEQTELEALSVSDMAAFDEGYQFGAAPEGALANLWTYLAAQLSTQGHFQGEGECPIDGVEHDH